MKYETIIGLEVHVELKTESKLCCGCSTKFPAEPNTLTCPVCLGLPGALPVLNKKAIDLSIKTGLALNCGIARKCQFDRKQYFYPDLPKGYQITQFYTPICRKGWLEIDFTTGRRRIGITRIHLEEEAGRSYHSGAGIIGSDYSLLDYNRSSIPLIEIVTEPELCSPREAKEFMEELKTILEYIEVSDCKMEEGSLRCDANVSVRRQGEHKLGKRAEVKNMNSFRAVEAALEYEAKRQIKLLEQKNPLEREESRTWDEERRETVFMRFKEKAEEYRYFPDPDLLPVIINDDWIEGIRQKLPELPNSKRERYVREFRLPKEDATLISSSKPMAEFFEAVVKKYGGEPKNVSNWVIGDLTRLMNQEKVEFHEIKLYPDTLAQMLKLLDQGVISSKIAKAVFEEMFYTGAKPEVIIEEKGLKQISNAKLIKKVVNKVMINNPQSVQDYLSGKKKALSFLVGQVMKETKGKANPGMVNDLLQKELAKRG